MLNIQVKTKLFLGPSLFYLEEDFAININFGPRLTLKIKLCVWVWHPSCFWGIRRCRARRSWSLTRETDHRRISGLCDLTRGRFNTPKKLSQQKRCRFFLFYRYHEIAVIHVGPVTAACNAKVWHALVGKSIRFKDPKDKIIVKKEKHALTEEAHKFALVLFDRSRKLYDETS